MEILVIDDGSTDRSGAICDEYAEKDSRIKVFHTENRGLSATRNLGLDHAQGEWIGFVDSDDWIEPDMYEALIRKAEETGADIAECGRYKEYPRKAEKDTKENQIVTRAYGTNTAELDRYKDCFYKTVEDRKGNWVISRTDAVNAMLHSKLCVVVWNKIWKRECFSGIRFPVGRIFEDIMTTYRIMETTGIVVTLDECKYHYLQRADSISETHTMKNLVGYWKANYERYVDRITFFGDWKIIFQTNRTVLKREGISGGGTETMSEFFGTESPN